MRSFSSLLALPALLSLLAFPASLVNAASPYDINTFGEPGHTAQLTAFGKDSTATYGQQFTLPADAPSNLVMTSFTFATNVPSVENYRSVVAKWDVAGHHAIAPPLFLSAALSTGDMSYDDKQTTTGSLNIPVVGGQTYAIFWTVSYDFNADVEASAGWESAFYTEHNDDSGHWLWFNNGDDVNALYNQRWDGPFFEGDMAYSVTFESSGGGHGDPQFTGFSGQSFQVHGTSGTVYNLISSRDLQCNALFTHLESGRCRAGTECFKHPGNYFGSVGFVLADERQHQHTLLIESGAVDVGMTVVYNNQTLSVGSAPIQVGIYTISLPTAFEARLESEEFNIRVANSDMFLNQDVSIGSQLMQKIAAHKRAAKQDATAAAQLAAELPHGLIGQTYENKVFPNRWKFIEGQLFDYVVPEGVFGSSFKYNRLQ